jgi:hypothetical protein
LFLKGWNIITAMIVAFFVLHKIFFTVQLGCFVDSRSGVINSILVKNVFDFQVLPL